MGMKTDILAHVFLGVNKTFGNSEIQIFLDPPPEEWVPALEPREMVWTQGGLSGQATNSEEITFLGLGEATVESMNVSVADEVIGLGIDEDVVDKFVVLERELTVRWT